MSKYRFKTKEEFIIDKLWDYEYDCPIFWNSKGEMNKYLGKDIPDEFSGYCDKNTSFTYDEWHFKSNEYVLKEQQEYFNDLSQHIGRYIRALEDNPYSGSGVKKGDVGKIVSDCLADFPNRKSYHCICALSENHLGVKYELLPEDYSPEQEFKEPSVEFIPGKWYHFTTMEGKYSLYAKVSDATGRHLFFMNGESISDGYFGKADCIDKKLIENPRLVEDLSEIQKYLPNEHPDKITSDVFKKGEYIVLISDGQSTGGTTLVQSDQFIKNHCYKVRENNRFLRPELDSRGSTTNGWECILYNPNKFHKTRNWRYATEKESIEYERRGKPYDVTELQKKETFPEYGCVVITDNPINLVNYLQNSNRKPSSNNNYDKEKTILAWNNGSYWFCSVGSSKTKYSKDYIETIIGQSIYSDKLLETKKELAMEEIQEKCKKRFPIGCTFIPVGSSNRRILKKDSYTYSIVGKQIWAHSGAGYLYGDGKWATLVSLPEEEPKKFEKPDVLYHSKSTIKVVKKTTKIKKPLAINSISINAIKK